MEEAPQLTGHRRSPLIPSDPSAVAGRWLAAGTADGTGACDVRSSAASEEMHVVRSDVNDGGHAQQTKSPARPSVGLCMGKGRDRVADFRAWLAASGAIPLPGTEGPARPGLSARSSRDSCGAVARRGSSSTRPAVCGWLPFRRFKRTRSVSLPRVTRRGAKTDTRRPTSTAAALG